MINFKYVSLLSFFHLIQAIESEKYNEESTNNIYNLIMRLLVLSSLAIMQKLKFCNIESSIQNL